MIKIIDSSGRELDESISDYSIEYSVFDKNDRVKVKQKSFKSDAARERFIDKLVDQSDFKEILAYSDPQ